MFSRNLVLGKTNAISHNSKVKKKYTSNILYIVMVFEFSPHFVELVRRTIGGI